MIALLFLALIAACFLALFLGLELRNTRSDMRDCAEKRGFDDGRHWAQVNTPTVTYKTTATDWLWRVGAEGAVVRRSRPSQTTGTPEHSGESRKPVPTSATRPGLASSPAPASPDTRPVTAPPAVSGLRRPTPNGATR